MIRAKEETAVKDRPKLKVAASGGKEPPRRPVVAAVSGDGPKFLPVTISLDQAMIDRIDNKAHEMRQTRSAAIRVLLSKALK